MPTAKHVKWPPGTLSHQHHELLAHSRRVPNTHSLGLMLIQSTCRPFSLVSRTQSTATMQPHCRLKGSSARQSTPACIPGNIHQSTHLKPRVQPIAGRKLSIWAHASKAHQHTARDACTASTTTIQSSASTGAAAGATSPDPDGAVGVPPVVAGAGPALVPARKLCCAELLRS
eukprot:scaffold271287_cov25-Tisochrysis_lutea.AAC.2